jgi:hypothetical protein
MKKIKISHEVPFCLLEESKTFNGYDYCLPHLMDQNPQYRDFFYKSKKEGRYIVMDNSLHELGKAYDSKRLLHWINEIKPNEFIVPDVWENQVESIVNARYWSKIKLPKGVTKVAVVQAQSLGEAMLCTKIYKELGYKKIAYSYGASYYNNLCPHLNSNIGKAVGRFLMISELFKSGFLLKSDRIHLLGTSWPAEFGMYKNMPFIESIDTSNPVMAALEGDEYGVLGINHKPQANMNSHADIEEKYVDKSLVHYNVEMFKQINGL